MPQSPARKAAIVLAFGQYHPAFMPLAQRIGGAGLMLGIEAVELLLQPILGRSAGIDRAAQDYLSHGG